MIIYEVYNKVSSMLFEDLEDAEYYLGKVGTPSNGLTIEEIQVFEKGTFKNNPPPAPLR